MDEQIKQTNPTENEVKTPLSLVERAEAAAQRIERAETEIKAAELRMQEIRTTAILSGQTNAGQPKEQKTPEQLKKEGAIEFWKGSGVDKAIEKYG